MGKHIITKENLIKDYKKVLIYNLFMSLVFIFILLLLLQTIIYSFSYLDLFFIKKHLLYVEIILLFIMMILYFVTIIDSVIEYLTIKNDKYNIVTSTLIELKEKQYYRSTLINILTNKETRPNILKFEKYGEYSLPTKNYTSDPYTTMTDDQVANSSAKKDVFILVVNKKNKILLAYNTKLFEYQE